MNSWFIPISFEGACCLPVDYLQVGKEKVKIKKNLGDIYSRCQTGGPVQYT